MKRLALVAVFACAFACAPEPKASRVEVAPLPTPEKSVRAPGGGLDNDVHLAVQDQVGDRDGDGIVDDLDKCPDDPEDRDGFQDDDGCPDPDNDGDGILDKNDQCPNDPGPPPSGCPQPKKKTP